MRMRREEDEIEQFRMDDEIPRERGYIGPDHRADRGRGGRDREVIRGMRDIFNRIEQRQDRDVQWGAPGQNIVPIQLQPPAQNDLPIQQQPAENRPLEMTDNHDEEHLEISYSENKVEEEPKPAEKSIPKCRIITRPEGKPLLKLTFSSDPSNSICDSLLYLWSMGESEKTMIEDQDV